MFNGNKRAASSQHLALAETIIGRGTKIVNGEMSGESSVRIDGDFSGLIDIEGDLILGEHGSIEGDIRARSAMIAGYTKSRLVDCNESLHIVSAGVVHGDITVGSLVVDEGAVFTGNCEMKTDLPMQRSVYGIESDERYELPEYIN